MPYPVDTLKIVSPIENPIPDANNHTLYYIIAGAMVLSAAMLWPYFRHRYPCLTVSDLKQKEKVLDNAYEHFRSVENLPLYGYGFELESMTRRRIALKRRASKIRVRSLELDATSLSICKIYLGFHPEIVGDIVTWNHDVEIIVRDILIIVESATQDHYGTQSGCKKGTKVSDIRVKI
ncbi:40s ribosomal protein s6, partial [Moniliophthora roreri]